MKIEKQCAVCHGGGEIVIFSLDMRDPVPLCRTPCTKCQGTGSRLATAVEEPNENQLDLFRGAE